MKPTDDNEVETVNKRHPGFRAVKLVIAGALAGALAAGGVVAHDDATTAHLWLDHIKTMKNPGTINDNANPVTWTKLNGVPNGFADGTDDGVEGAGYGLSKLVDILYVDWTKIQHRVQTSCSVGQALRSIDEGGVATCTVGPKALTKIVGDTGFMCDHSYCTEGAISLTPGTWSISATIFARQAADFTDALWVACRLDAGGLSDTARFAADSRADPTLSMQLIADLGRDARASVNCKDEDVGDAQGTSLSIIAIRLD